MDHGRIQLARAWRHALESEGEEARRAEEKTVSWIQALAGMAAGVIKVGRRDPVAGLPAWVTLEVLHGGFASGRAPAEDPPDISERALFHRFGVGSRGELNRFFLGEEGLRTMSSLVKEEDYRIELPEEAVHPTLAILMTEGRTSDAVELLRQVHPFFERLRFYPVHWKGAARPAPGTVHRFSVSEVRRTLQRYRLPLEIRRMRESLLTWRPLYEEALEAVRQTVEEGWPFQVYPRGWRERFQQLPQRCRRLLDGEVACHFPQRAESNLRHLMRALTKALQAPGSLTGREVSLVRAIYNDSVKKWGEIGSAERTRSLSGRNASLTERAPEDFVPALDGRLRLLPQDGGISDFSSILEEALPEVLRERVLKARQGSLEELFEAGLFSSADTLASVVPQLASRVVAGRYGDRTLAERTYRAFCSRRSLLLTNLAHQMRFAELPWVAAMERSGEDVGHSARELATELVRLLWLHFPQTMVPNPMVSQLNELLKAAGYETKLAEELAADIFVDAFSESFARLVRAGSRAMEGTLYQRYYGVPRECRELTSAAQLRDICTRRAERRGAGEAPPIVRNGMIIEEQQTLTAHNLFFLQEILAPEVDFETAALACLAYCEREMSSTLERPYLELLRNRRVAQAWRQMVFFLSNCEGEAFFRRKCPAMQSHLGVLESCRHGSREGEALYGWTNGLPVRF